MNETIININEQKVAEAFSQQSKRFDQFYSGNTIIQYKRERVRDHLQQLLRPESFILELNSGTGEDATWLAQHGYTVHATDISAGMMNELKQKIRSSRVEDKVSTEICSFTELKKLINKGPYDCIFSNFAGLNCTDELDKVLHSFSPLLKSKGIVTLVILPKFCLWEFLLVFKGRFKTAFRRFFSRKGRTAHLEGHYFKCWYYDPSYIIHHLKKDFDVISIEGLCTLVPPSYIENFAEKHPKKYNWLKAKEDKWKTKWPWKNIGDYYIISLRKKS
jgi:ubiquinone/menaquinone biosynthesis C-methylase UbiE